MNNPHHYIKRDFGHSDLACEYCNGTPRENEAIGEINHCDEAPEQEKVSNHE